MQGNTATTPTTKFDIAMPRLATEQPFVEGCPRRAILVVL